MFDHRNSTLPDTLVRVGPRRLLAASARLLRRQSGEITEELRNSALAEIPAFTESGNPDVLPELARHASEHTKEIIRLLGGGPVGDFGFVTRHASIHAEQRFPLEATLHAYRCMHKVISHKVRNALLAAADSPDDAPHIVAGVADFTIEYTDAISTVATSAYVAQTRLLADVAGDHRVALLNILLDGYDESDGRVANVLRDAGYLDQRQSFCVVLAQPVDAAEMQNPARARRLADSVSRIMDGTSARQVADVRNDVVTTVFSDARRASGWTAPRATLAGRIAENLSMLGNAVLVGVSNDVPSTSQIPRAYKEARLALEIADVSRRVVQFSEIPVRELLLHLAGETFHRTLPSWAGSLIEADEKSRGILVETLRAYADSDMNVLRSAEQLAVHPNTIYARLARIKETTGLDARSFHALNELLIVAECNNCQT
jgi:hypothetical protein